ncbi:unnamed protein product [Cunninghamella echinulata]
MRGLYTLVAVAISLLGLTNAAESYNQNVLNRWQNLDKTVQSNHPNMKKIQREWNSFTIALQHEYPETTPLFIDLKAITEDYASVEQWQQLIANTASKLDLKITSKTKEHDTPSTTQAAHENQATW